MSVRAGVDYEWIPGWLRVRDGGYYEPSRFLDPSGQAVSGRLHGTAGVEGRVLSFSLLDSAYRIRLAVTADVANNYLNGGFSVGFWR